MTDLTPTPHNSGKAGQIAKTVIMPGDPLRSKMIAETLLDNAQLVNNVRGMQGYTGTYRGVPITVMAHGMGNPSMGIYSYELFKFYDVDNIIRVGTIGSLDSKIELRSIILAEKSYTTTNYDDYYINNGAGYVSASKDLVDVAKRVAAKNNLATHISKVWCSETFYTDTDQVAFAKKHRLLGVEMESAALYINAAKLGKKALAICTVSDNVATGEKLDSDARQNSFVDMIKLALDVAVEISTK